MIGPGDRDRKQRCGNIHRVRHGDRCLPKAGFKHGSPTSEVTLVPLSYHDSSTRIKTAAAARTKGPGELILSIHWQVSS